ncbi:MAG TPA: radical SAM protein [Halomicronema sp.]
MVETIRPRTLRLEASTHCQLKCPACETTQGITKEKLGSGFLKLEDFKKIVDENPWLAHIELSNWGEIFLNPDIVGIMEYAYQKSVALTASNGANLNTVKPAVLEAIVKYKFRHINCSIDGASQEIYQMYRVNGNFDRVIENVKTINHYKKEYGTEFPFLNWQFVIFGHNEHELEKAQEMAQSLNMKFKPKLSWDEKISPVKNAELVKRITKLNAASRSEYYEKNETGYMQKSICGQLWTGPQVNWDGRILGCCFNQWGDFGNAFESGVESGLNNEKINYARQMLLGQVEAKDGIPCTTCGHYKRMQEKENWLVESEVRKTNIPFFKKWAYGLGMGRLSIYMTNRYRWGEKIFLKYFNPLKK